jgi:CspA family cold shock protein
MEGIFKGWVPDKTFGFITPRDGSDDVFVHQRDITSPQELKAGATLCFDIQLGEKGPYAVKIALLAPAKRLRGCVQFWNDRGFGFIAAGGTDVFVHASALPVAEEGYLCEGDVVEFCALEGKKGFDASDIQVIDWKKPRDHLTAFADMGPPGWLDDLAGCSRLILSDYAASA